jgi:hypothetical protein
LKPHSLRSNQFLLLGHQLRLSKCPLFPKAFQQEALLPLKVNQWLQRHKVLHLKLHNHDLTFKQSLQA